MTFKTIKSICFSCFALLLLFYPSKIDALSPDWVAVPKSQYGEQLWDKNSIQKNKDGSIRVFSKFIPKSTTDITQDILYTMDVNCSENSFRDVAVGAKEFNQSSTAKELIDFVNDLSEYIKGGKDGEHQILREAYGHLGKPKARKIKDYFSEILEDAQRYEKERRRGRRKTKTK